MNGAVVSIQSRLEDAIRRLDVDGVERVDNEVRNVVAQAISHDSEQAVRVLRSLKDVYAGLIESVTAERSRVADELRALGKARRGVSAYQGAPDA